MLWLELEYNKTMQKVGIYKTRGFTVIEVLIVIFIIGVLSALVFVNYSGVQDDARNAQKITDLKAWKNVFDTYAARKGGYPDPGPTSSPTNVDSRDGSYGYCLGTGFPNGKCREYEQPAGELTYNESDNADLMTELKTVVPNLPTGPKIPVGGGVGPFVSFRPESEGGNIHMITFLKSSEDTCPNNLLTGWYDSDTQLLQCQIQLIRNR